MTEFNYFAEREQESQKRFQSLRDSLLNPIVRLLIRCRISADMISCLSMLMLIPFGFLLLRATGPDATGSDSVETGTVAVASIFVWLHVILDAFDGPIARHNGTAGPAGAFTDMSVDHSGMLITATLLTAAGFIDGTVGVVYASSYTLAIVFTIWLNVLGRPFAVVLRTKYLLYGMTSLYGVTGFDRDIFNTVVIGFCVVHTCYAIAGFLRVKAILRSSPLEND